MSSLICSSRREEGSAPASGAVDMRPRGSTTAVGSPIWPDVAGGAPATAPEAGALVRLRRRGDRAVEVRSCAAKSRAVSNRNCAAARQGGEQRERERPVRNTDSSGGSRRELDSVGVDGRACERKAKPVEAGANPLAAGRSPVVAPMVGDGMAGSPPAIIRETRRGQAAFMALEPEEPPGGSQSVRSSQEAGNDRGAKGRRKVDA